MAKKVIETHSEFWNKKRELTIPKIGTFGQDFLVYALLLLAVMLLLGFIPFIGNMNPLYRWVVIPFGISWLLDRNLVDGKSPIGFMRSTFYYIGAIISGKTYIKYKSYKKKLDSYSVNGKLTVRIYEGG